jgi:hypothetical protein
MDFLENLMEEHRMRRYFRLFLWGVFVLILVLTASCSSQPAASTTGAEPAAPVVKAEEQLDVEEEAVDPINGEENEAPVEDAGTGGQEPVSDSGIAGDIPIPEDAYQVQVAQRGTTVLFQIDGEIDDVVGFFQENLPNNGWDLVGPPDTSMGSIATLLRKNEAGDQLSINMQGNQLGGFVRVTIVILRAN